MTRQKMTNVVHVYAYINPKSKRPLRREEQVTIFRLRSQHVTSQALVPHPCPDETVAHFLVDYPLWMISELNIYHQTHCMQTLINLKTHIGILSWQKGQRMQVQ